MKINKDKLRKFVFKTLNESNWIAGAIEHKGALKKDLGLDADKKVTTSLITKEIDKLKEKDKDERKPGIQGLTKSDLHLLKRLNLAKTLAKVRRKNKNNQ